MDTRDRANAPVGGGWKRTRHAIHVALAASPTPTTDASTPARVDQTATLAAMPRAMGEEKASVHAMRQEAERSPSTERAPMASAAPLPRCRRRSPDMTAASPPPASPATSSSPTSTPPASPPSPCRHRPRPCSRGCRLRRRPRRPQRLVRGGVAHEHQRRVGQGQGLAHPSMSSDASSRIVVSRP